MLYFFRAFFRVVDRIFDTRYDLLRHLVKVKAIDFLKFFRLASVFCELVPARLVVGSV